MSEGKRTKILNEYPEEAYKQSFPLTSDLTALFEIIRLNPERKLRKDAATHLLKLIEKDGDIPLANIAELYKAEKDIGVATELKRAMNKIQIRSMLTQDPTLPYDRKLSSEEEEKVSEEIDRLRELYDSSRNEKGAFDKKYKMLDQIGKGGMGRIFKCMRVEDKQIVAIKLLLLKELAKNNNRERIIARFKREGTLLIKRLKHPHIIKAYEYGESNGEYFLILAYLEDGSLADMISQKPLDFETFKFLSIQLCEALQYIHENGIIHRDINPSNMLITGRNGSITIKLSDFGLSKDKRDQSISRISFFAGTDDYSSPQQLEDARNADERDDIFSMGKSFYHMLTGRTFENSEPYEEISKYNSAVPNEIDMIVKRCIELNKQDRYQNATELLTAIKGIKH
jgi:tRNA A-37 threonylcarbamoyl transferase component Bud32